MSTLKERIKAYCKAKKISISKFEANIMSSQGWVNKLNDKLSDRKIQDITKYYPDLNIDWLIYDRGNMFVSETLPTYQSSNANLSDREILLELRMLNSSIAELRSSTNNISVNTKSMYEILFSTFSSLNECSGTLRNVIFRLNDILSENGNGNQAIKNCVAEFINSVQQHLDKIERQNDTLLNLFSHINQSLTTEFNINTRDNTNINSYKNRK